MRIRTLIISTLTAATAAVLLLSAVSFNTSLRLSRISRAQAHAQAVAHEASSLLVLTHEYSLHDEPRAAFQWHKRHDSLLKKLGRQEPMPTETIEQVHTLGELFTQLESGSATASLKRQRKEILLDQLLTNTQFLSDQYHELSLELSTQDEATENTLHVTGILIPVISLLSLLFIFMLLAIRVLRPLAVMRKAVDAVAQGDLTVRSDTGSGDEFGELSRAFDTMALDLVTQLKQEISERKQIEENLQHIVDERTLSLKTIVDTAADGIITIDDRGVVLSLNRATEKIFGYAANEVIGHNVSMLMPESDKGAHNGYMKNYQATGEARVIGRGRESEGRHKDGHCFPIYLAISEVVLANERRFTGIVRDISEQKTNEANLIAARDEAERASKAKSEFLSSMSHELRTPMNAILGFGQLMQFDDALPAVHKGNVQEILSAGYHLLELINDVLDLSSIESGQIDLSLEPVEVCSVVDGCLNLVGNMAAKRDIKISHSGVKGVAVLADRTRLKQVILNLLSNAIKYNREGGSVTLEVKHMSAERLRILVTDTGLGIPAARLTELFKPFSRLDAANSTIEGTGIGLTIARRIAEMMGGSVDVRSEVGVGSTFWIELPLASMQQTDYMSDENNHVMQPADTNVAQFTILYIEDNPSNLRLVTQILSRHKHIHLLTALKPEWGIELAQSYRPDLILLDINMPGMDGYEVLRVLKAEASLKTIPVVAVTASAMPRDIERGKAAGFTDYLTKPLDVARFDNVIESILNPVRQR